jgi:hypothetical protein
LEQTGRLLMERAPRALLLIALQLNFGVIAQQATISTSLPNPSAPSVAAIS